MPPIVKEALAVSEGCAVTRDRIELTLEAMTYQELETLLAHAAAELRRHDRWLRDHGIVDLAIARALRDTR